MQRGNWALIAGIVAVVVLVGVGFVAAGRALGGDAEPATKEEYRAAVLNARDRTDYALGRFSTAQTPEELLERMDEAAASIDQAAAELADETVPAEFEDETAALVRHMQTLSADVQATADQARVPGYEQIVLGGGGFDWATWPKMNAVFAELREQGVAVPALEPHEAT